MEALNFKNHISKLSSQRNIFLLFSSMLVLAVVLLSILLYKKQERIVIVPTTGSSFWLEGNQTSQAYVENMGVYLADLLLNRSPIDVEWRNKKVLSHIHPTFYHQARKLLEEEKKKILDRKEANIIFRPSLSYVDEKHSSYFIEGERLVLVGKDGSESSVAQSDRQRYKFDFKCENGRLYLISIKKEEIL